MNILILSRKRRFYSTRRLIEECRKLKHTPLVIDPLKCILYINHKTSTILAKGIELSNIDVVVPRIGMVAVSYAISVIRQFEVMGIPVVNSNGPIARSRNKLGCLQLLAQNGIPVPETLISRYPRNLNKLIRLIGGTPIIMKLLKGTQGTGVILSESTQSVESVLETIWSLGEDILLQRFIKESKGRDIRVFIIGDRVAAAMRRYAKEGEFRSNIHKGGYGEPLKLSKEYEAIAIKSAKMIGLGVAGVDMLESKDGPLVIEVNSSPGFQGLEEATKLNIAKMIVEYAVKLGRMK